ncbi:MAG: beta-ketoacyl-[acyl-carrier-protein] synthase family protein, partial [Chitinivibrionales bacterium]|nr:beta-ketoacyl-[acyl-carrier-protein] synthase family protein [Chitinivibrionales bacterium]
SINNALHMTGLHPEGTDIAKSIEMVLKDARVNKESVDYVSAHGSGTKQNDTSETAAYKKVFGERAYKIPISSLKSVLGHSLGAATAVELVTCCLGIKHGYVTPTLNIVEKDETCDLDYIPDQGREMAVNCVLKNASGFSGIHSTLVLKKV